MSAPLVIVGANLAGGAAAIELRRSGYEGEIVLIGEEPDPPYERPPLSKEYLRGESDFDRSLLQPLSWYSEAEVEVILGVRASRLDVGQRVVELANGSRLSYEKVLIATGGRNRRLDVPGADLENIFDLRTHVDADDIRKAASDGGKAVVVGMGFIGAEVAASLRLIGVEVTAVEIFSVPLERVLGHEFGAVAGRLHADQGVEILANDTVSEFRGSSRVEQVLTDSGRQIDADFVVVGVGIVPNTEITDGTGIAVDNGIVTDELCRTNVEGVYAAGDVANHFHPLAGRHIRVEHWQNALRQGAAAARSMISQGDPYTDVHWFWSDQYDLTIQHAGFEGETDRRVVRGSMEDRDFIAFDLAAGTIRSAVAFGRQRELRAAMKLMEAQAEVDPKALVDEDVDLRRLKP
ncbi:MAG: NAD(P)/FAD-dependent oxidoreductase [Acidimicrobiia bacterium]